MTTEHQPGSPVTAEQAHESHQRLVDHFFGNPAERPRVSIPARLDRDDDLVVSRYIDQAEAELRTLRARVESYAMDLAALEGTNAANEGALRIQLERLHGERFRAESAEARVAELEKLFDDAGQGEHNVLALIDHYQSEAMAESEARRAALARVGELECAEADLEAQLAAAREEQGLEAKVREVLRGGFEVLKFERMLVNEQPAWFCDTRIIWPHHSFVSATTLPALLRAILEVEAKGG